MILSIFIATYNRKEIVVNKIKELLRIQSKELDIFVLDDVSGDGTTDALKQIKDLRLHIGTNSERVGILKDGAMPNWYHLLLQVLLINKELKRAKVVQIAKRYLFYCTLNYAFFISDAGQTAHYGIEPMKLTRKKLFAIMQRFVDESYRILQEYGMGDKERKYKATLISYFWAIYFGKPVWDKIKQFRS